MKFTSKNSKLTRILALTLVLTFLLGMSALTSAEDDHGELPFEPIDIEVQPSGDEEDLEPQFGEEDDSDEPDDEEDDIDPQNDDDATSYPDNEPDEPSLNTMGQTTADTDPVSSPEIASSATANAADAATLTLLLNDEVTEVINVTAWLLEPTGAIALKMDKTIVLADSTNSYNATIGGNITGGYTISVQGSQQYHGQLNINGTFDCSFNVTNGWIYFDNSSAVLGLNRTLTIGANSSNNWGYVAINGTFVNNGNIIINGNGTMQINEGATLLNSGTVTINRFRTDDYGYYLGDLSVYGAFNNNGGTVNNNGRITSLPTGMFQRPTTLRNANGIITGRSASNFSGAFSFLTFDANGGAVGWYESPSIVMAEPSGIVFDLTKFGFMIGMYERTGYAFSGWFSQRTGGTLIEMDNTAFAGAGQTLFAQWVEATSPKEIVDFLRAPGDSTLTLKIYPEVWYSVNIYLEDFGLSSIVLGGNKTIIAGAEDNGSVSIYIRDGGLTGDYTLTIRRGQLGVNGIVNCNITLTDWASFSNWSSDGDSNAALAAGRVINAENGSVDISRRFENRGTIRVNHMW